MTSQPINVRDLLASLNAEYDSLVENRDSLEAECSKMREYIENQVQQITTITADIDRLRQDFLASRETYGPQGTMPAVPIPQAEQEQDPGNEDMPPYEVIPLVQPQAITHPLAIGLTAEIVDVSVICSTCFSPDGIYLAIGSDKTLRVYNIEADKFALQATIAAADPEKENHVRSICWTPDSKYIICGVEDHTIRIFSVEGESESRDPEHTFEAGAGEVFQVLMTPDGEKIVSATGDGVVEIWQAKTYNFITSLTRENANEIVATSIAISPDGQHIAVGYSDNQLAMWSIGGALEFIQTVHDKGVYSVKFTPDGQRLVTSSLDSSVRIWDVSSDRLTLWKELREHENYVLTLDIDPTGEWLLSGSKDLRFILTNLREGRMVYAVKSHTNTIISVSFNPTRSSFCTGSGDHSVKIWTYQPSDNIF